MHAPWWLLLLAAVVVGFCVAVGLPALSRDQKKSWLVAVVLVAVLVFFSLLVWIYFSRLSHSLRGWVRSLFFLCHLIDRATRSWNFKVTASMDAIHRAC